MRGAPTTLSPAIEARPSRPLVRFWATNGVSMNAPFGIEVQSNARGLGGSFAIPGRGSNSSATEGGERQEGSSFGGKSCPKLDFVGRSAKVEFSKPRILRPDGEFESHPLRSQSRIFRVSLVISSVNLQ